MVKESQSARPRPDEGWQTSIERIPGKPVRIAHIIKATGLASPFHAAGPHTVFAPNDLAFGKHAEALRADLFKPEGKARMTAI